MAVTPKTTPGQPDASPLLQVGPGIDAQAQRRKLADSLIGTHFFPDKFQTMRVLALQAQAYHQLRPYPYWYFTQWKTEDRGILPTCLPIARRAVIKSARWLFGKPLEIHVKEASAYEKFIREQWQLNRMPTRMVAAAEIGGTDGGYVIKWSYDENAVTKLRFQILSAITETRLYYNPHDGDDLLMARIQYPVPHEGRLFMYREEWTDQWEIHYRLQEVTNSNLSLSNGSGSWGPYPIGQVPVVIGAKVEPDLYDKWIETGRTENPFGVIPLHPIHNAEGLATFGRGDFWTDVTGGMFRVLDRINLAMHLGDRSNQLHGEPIPVFIDAKVGPDVVDKPLRPGESISIKSDEGYGPTGGKQAQVNLLEADGAMRPHIQSYAQDLKRELLDTIGSVDVDTSEVGNKGNLTEAVLEQLYAPLIATTEEKRKTQGDDGVARLLEKVAVSLKNLGAKEAKEISVDKRETYDVQLRWAEYFILDDATKQLRFTRVMDEANLGALPPERAVEIVLQMEGVQDIPAAKEELKGAMERQERAREATVQQQEADVEATKNPPAAAGAGGKAGAGASWRGKSK